jgi:asparagine synthase (glutamine-hydrolysing)
VKCAVLFSGGKDSTYAAYIAKKAGYGISCLIAIISENPDSYMFHTPSILKVKKQAEVMNKPLIVQKTKGEKEIELKDLEEAIIQAKKEFDIEAIVAGAVESIYQASRIQKICDKLDLECFNPLWQKDQFELLHELIKNKFEVIITGVSAYKLDKTWLGKKIDNDFLKEIKTLYEKYQINPAGEGGEYETFVLNCPLFEKKLKIIKKEISGSKNSWKMEVEVE